MEKEVVMIVKSPISCTEEQFEEWVRFETGNKHCISYSNPLHEYELDAEHIEFK
jgi:hypothetical protein